MTQTLYKCYYSFGGSPNRFYTYIPDIATAKEGFWLNKDCEFTIFSDCHTWISPSSVLFVEKEYREIL